MNEKETAKKWYKQALHDLVIAEKNITIEGYDVAAFLSHQAVEKLLKALFILQGKNVPRTHYIDELACMLNLSDDVLTYIYDLITDYTIARYPDVSDLVPYEQYNQKIACQKVTSAKRVFELLVDSYKILIKDDNNE